MWKGASVTRVTKPDKLVLWKKIMSDGKGGDDVVNNPARWTDDDEDERVILSKDKAANDKDARSGEPYRYQWDL